MCMPVEEDKRLPKELIKIEYCKPEDLVEWLGQKSYKARPFEQTHVNFPCPFVSSYQLLIVSQTLLVYESFARHFWDLVEVKENRPSLAIRTKATAKHWLPWLTQPGFHAIKAVHARTGEIMGVAGWHECGTHAIYPTTYDVYPGVTFPPWFVPCAWRDDVAFPPSPSAESPLGLTERMGWTAEDVAEMTSFHDSQGYAAAFNGYDIARLHELGEQPHWYLAPFAVWPRWRGRGVGGALMRWALDQADEKGWPAILEALPNARPVYYRFGFQPTVDHGEGKEFQLVRPAKKA